MQRDRVIWLVVGAIFLYATYRVVSPNDRPAPPPYTVYTAPPPQHAAPPAPAPAAPPAARTPPPAALAPVPAPAPVASTRSAAAPKRLKRPPPPPPPPVPPPTPNLPIIEAAASCPTGDCTTARASRVVYDIVNSGFFRDPASSVFVAPPPYRGLHIAIVMSGDTPTADRDMTLYRALAAGLNKGTYKLTFIQLDDGSDRGLSETLKEQCRTPVLHIPVFPCTTGYCTPADSERIKLLESFQNQDVVYYLSHTPGTDTESAEQKRWAFLRSVASAAGVPIRIEHAATVQSTLPIGSTVEAVVTADGAGCRAQPYNIRCARINSTIDDSSFTAETGSGSIERVAFLWSGVCTAFPADLVKQIKSAVTRDASMIVVTEEDATCARAAGLTANVWNPKSSQCDALIVLPNPSPAAASILPHALAKRILVIGTRKDGVADLITKNTGILVTDSSPAGFTAALQSAYQNKAVVQKLVAAAAESVKAYHNSARLVAAHAALFEDLCYKHCTPSRAALEVSSTIDNSKAPREITGPKYGFPGCRLTAIVLAREGVKTLRNTLTSYRELGLHDVADELLIWWQGIGGTVPGTGMSKKCYVEQFGFHALGSDHNIMFQAFKNAVDAAKCKYVLFLEEDFAIYTLRHEAADRLRHAMDLMDSNEKIVQVRVRNHENPGEPMYARHTFNARGWIESTHELWSLTWTRTPEVMYKGRIYDCTQPGKSQHFCTSTQHADWSWNPFIINREFFIKNMKDRFAVDHANSEPTNSAIWRDIGKDWIVAANWGVFTHHRMDRGGYS